MRHLNTLILHATVAVGAWLSPAVTMCSANVTTVTASSGGQKLTVSIEHELPGLGSALRGDSRGAFILLPVGFTPLGVSQNGIVLLRNETHYFRWRAGVLLALDPYKETTTEIQEKEDGTRIESTRYTEFQISARGDIGISTHDNVSITKPLESEADSNQATIKVWPPDSDTPWNLVIPSFSYDYLWDCWIPVSVSHRSAYMNAIDGTGRVWVNMGRRLASFDCGEQLVTGLVGVDANGTHYATPFEDPYAATSINRQGTIVGRTYDREDGAPSNWVDGQKVDFFPHFISDRGLVLGGPDEYSWNRFVVYPDGHQEEGPSDDNTVVVYPDGHRERVPLPASTVIESIDALGRLHGYHFVFNMDTDSWEPQKAVWVRATNEQGLPKLPVEWERADYERLALPDGWTTDLTVAPGALAGPLVGMAKRGATQPFLFIPINARLLVDANRDGLIDDAGTSDATTSASPFRFWINDDIDRTHVTNNDLFQTANEQDDLETSPDGKVDWQENLLPCGRDLEDFARLWISTQGLTTAFRPKDFTDEADADFYLGLQWAAVGKTGSPAIKIYPAVEADGGNQYLSVPAIADQQVNFDYAMKDFRDKATPEISLNNVVAGTDFFVIPPRYFARLSDAQPKTHFLFEGVSAGKGQLVLVILIKENGSFTKIGDGPGVWFDLQNIRNLYQTWTVGDNANPDVHADIMPTPTRSPVSGSPTLPAPAMEEEKDFILFVHGWNMKIWEKDRYAETAVKRLWWQGYKGRFGAFRWPTYFTRSYGENDPTDSLGPPLDPWNFDSSELNSWRSAQGLLQLITELKGTYHDSNGNSTVRVLAHSHGNIAVSEALRQATSSIVHTYVASQAALAAHCFDRNAAEISENWQNGHWYLKLVDEMGLQPVSVSTPNVYAYYPGSTGLDQEVKYPTVGQPYMAGAVGCGKWVNFFNQNDWALDGWITDQALKPDVGFDYRLWSILYPVTPAYWGFIEENRTPVLLTIPADTFRIFSFAAQARSQPLGRQPDVMGVFNGQQVSWNAYGDKHPGHSAEFRSSIAQRGEYWQKLLVEFALKAAP